MKLSFHHGTGADLQEAIADKIQELSQVESCENVTDAEVEASISTGSGLELEDAIRNKIAELSGSVESATEVTASVESEICPNCGSNTYYDGTCTTCGYIASEYSPVDFDISEELDIRSERSNWDAVCDMVVSDLMDQGYWPTYDILDDGIVIHVYADPGKNEELYTYTREFGGIDWGDPINSHGYITDKVVEAIQLEMEDQITSSTEVSASKEDDPTYRDRYLHSLIGDLTDVLNTNGVQGTLFDNDDENLYITISTAENPATEYQVPFADLKLDFDKMDEDIDYILDGILPKPEDITSSVEAVSATYKDPNLDPLYHGYLNRAENHIAELSKRYSKGHESPDEILKSLGYVEVEDNLYRNEDAPYAIFIDFNQDNDFDVDELWVLYYVTKNGHIPRGYCPTKTDIYDAKNDPDVTEDAQPTYTMVATKSVPDSDGFMTDYTWYKDSDGLNVFILGDNELYTPENTGFDNIEHSDEAAQEWWDNFNGYEDDDIVTYDADDIYTCEEAKKHLGADIKAAWSRDWYFGKEQSDQYGDLIAEKLSGRTVSKRINLSKEPGGLEYEADQLGIDMWDLLGALEGMCYEHRATEIDDSTYKVL